MSDEPRNVREGFMEGFEERIDYVREITVTSSFWRELMDYLEPRERFIDDSHGMPLWNAAGHKLVFKKE